MRIKLKLFWLFCFAFLSQYSVFAQSEQNIQNPPFLPYMQHRWVDSVFNSLSQEERLAQLFMVAAYSNRDSVYEKELVKYVSENSIGGVIFFQGGPVRQAMLTNRLQKASKVPLMVGMDAEWGLKMRLDSTTRFPYQMALGAITDPHLIYETGVAMARHCRRLGVQVSFSPVLDINNNPGNPVINFRSFGENKEEVKWRGFELTKGLQDHTVLAVAKHFPGHGDTDTDSHHDLPVISFTRNRLDSMELSPFRFSIDNGVSGVMVAHLDIPTLDTTGVPSTLSENIVSNLLQEELGFQGLVFTDALNMKGVTKYYQPGEVDLLAFKAGNDVMLFSEDVPKAIELIMEGVKNGQIDEAEIDRRCRKVLAAKYWSGLSVFQPIQIEGLVDDLNTPEDKLLNFQLAEASLTVLKNENDVIPIRELGGLKIASISVGTDEKTEFQEMLENYLVMDHFQISAEDNFENYEKLRDRLFEYDLIIAGIHNVKVYPGDRFGIKENEIYLINQISESGKGIIVHFGNPYALNYFLSLDRSEGVIEAYQETPYTQSLSAQLIFGAVNSSGKLPVSINYNFPQGLGISFENIHRLKYSIPEEVGLDSRMVQKIDSFAAQAISQKAAPGCQILAAKDGKVIWQKSYGFHTYDSLTPVRDSDIYDLASITKVAASTTALMKLYEDGLLNLDVKLSDYLPYFKKGNKSDITLREVLAHQSGLKSWIPFWMTTVKKNGKFKWFTFKHDSSKRFPIKVADELYIHRKYKKKLYKQIRKSEMGDKVYVYSDMSFYLYPEIVENITGQSFMDYLEENFYQPMGARSFTFNPYKTYAVNDIVPTEYDSLFRKQLLHGTVHDEGSSMMGGLSGHAGLFANGNDLLKMAQMWCNGGEYGGQRYLKEETIREWTRCQYCVQNDNRRALGFDRPLEQPHANGNTAKSVSQSSFGHSGFTGTFVWVDPESEIVYVFLSNRVYPTRENKELFRLNTRTNIQEVLYEAGEKLTDY